MLRAFLRKVPTVPVKWRIDAILGGLILIGWGVGFAAGSLYKPVHLTKFVYSKVSIDAVIRQYGRPDSGGDGAQIGFPGTTCFVWYQKKILICK